MAQKPIALIKKTASIPQPSDQHATEHRTEDLTGIVADAIDRNRADETILRNQFGNDRLPGDSTERRDEAIENCEDNDLPKGYELGRDQRAIDSRQHHLKYITPIRIFRRSTRSTTAPKMGANTHPRRPLAKCHHAQQKTATQS